jgi:hypothetical protein
MDTGPAMPRCDSCYRRACLGRRQQSGQNRFGRSIAVRTLSSIERRHFMQTAISCLFMRDEVIVPASAWNHRQQQQPEGAHA